MQIQMQSQQMQNAIHTLDLKVKHSYRSWGKRGKYI